MRHVEDPRNPTCLQIQQSFLATLPSDEHHRRSANARVVHRIVCIQPFLFAVWSSEFGFETHDGLFNADFVFVWFPAVAREEGGDGKSGKCGSERIEHVGELEIREGAGIIRVILL